MLMKISNYKGVIIFYLLLILFMVLISSHNKSIDMNLRSTNIIEEY